MPLNGTVKNSYSGKFYVACISPLSKKLNLLEMNIQTYHNARVGSKTS